MVWGEKKTVNTTFMELTIIQWDKLTPEITNKYKIYNCVTCYKRQKQDAMKVQDRVP